MWRALLLIAGNFEKVRQSVIDFSEINRSIHSPGEPEYLPNKECEWVVTAPQNQQIEITFKYFEVESHAECRFDKLEIRNGGNRWVPDKSILICAKSHFCFLP